MRNYRKLPPHMQAAADKATAERKLCRDWLRSLMRVSPVKAQTKADLRAEAMARFKVSRNAFDPGSDWAIMDSGIMLGGNRSSVRKTRRPRQDCLSGKTRPVTPFPSDPDARAGFAGARGSP
jgi:hypothetical protein